MNPHATANDVDGPFSPRAGAAGHQVSFLSCPHARLTVDAGSIPDCQDQSFGMDVQFTTAAWPSAPCSSAGIRCGRLVTHRLA